MCLGFRDLISVQACSDMITSPSKVSCGNGFVRNDTVMLYLLFTANYWRNLAFLSFLSYWFWTMEKHLFQNRDCQAAEKKKSTSRKPC